MGVVDFPDSSEEIELARRWLDNRRADRIDAGPPDLEPDDRVLELTLTDVDPERGWRVVIALLRAAQTEQDLTDVAIGPLETLLREHGTEFLHRTEQLANSDQRFRKALKMIYPHGDIVDLVHRLGLHGTE
jgi:hypothetical protein